MKTSIFKQAGLLPNAVAIARGVPRGWAGLRYLALAPSRWLLKAARGPDGAAVYDQHLTEQLSHLALPTVYRQLLELKRVT
jgi:hypothetical protein